MLGPDPQRIASNEPIDRIIVRRYRWWHLVAAILLALAGIAIVRDISNRPTPRELLQYNGD